MSVDALNGFLAIQPSRFRFLEAFALTRMLEDGSASAYQLELRLASNPVAGAPRLAMQFEGVCNLQIGDLEGLMGLLVEIRSIAIHGLEALRYRVVESEADAFSFDCASLHFEIVDGP